MKLVEIKKGEADIKRGQVMMAVEGQEDQVMAMVRSLKAAGHEFSDCAEESDDGEGLVAFFMIDRRDVKAFKADYKAAK